MQDNNLNGFFAWFAGHHVAANLLMTILLVAGAATAVTMNVEIFPKVDPRLILVNVPYPGASPEEVEEGISLRVESAILGVEGIKKISSSAYEGAGSVVVHLEDDANDREVLDDIKTALDQLQSFPPDDADDVKISDATSKEFVINIALYGDVSERTLRELAFSIRDDLITFDEISIANVLGARNYEIGVEVSESALRKYNLSFSEIANAVRGFSVNLPGGTIRTEVGEFLLRADHQAYDRSDFEQIPVRTNPDGTILRLKDVAEIDDGFTDGDVMNLFNGKPAVFIDVLKIGDHKVLAIEERVKDYVNNLALPAGIKAVTWSNRASELRSRIDLLIRNGLLGVILVFAVLLLFLNLKLAFWTTMGIPISFLGGIIAINAMGGTINMISLFAFIVVLGIVVDDAIIVGESIFTKIEEGMKPLQAAVAGLQEVITPVTIGILTTVIAFVPMFFTDGILGQILAVIPLVVISVLLLSLVEACMILPAHLSNVKIDNRSGAIPYVQEKFRSTLQRFVDNVYLPTLKYALRMPYVILAIAISAFTLTYTAVDNGLIKTAFFPQIDSNAVAAKLRMPNGTPAKETEAAIRHIMKKAEELREEYDAKLPAGSGSIIQNISAHVGSTPIATRDDLFASSSSARSHVGEVRIDLLEGENRPFTTTEIENRWRELIGEIADGNLRFFSGLFGVGESIYVELAHADFEQLNIAADQLKNVLSEYNGVFDIENSFNEGKPELQLELNDVGLASGLTVNELARQVRQAYYGEEAQRVQRGRDDIEVLVRYARDERRSYQSIYDMRIRLNDGNEVPFRTVATIKEGRGYSSIERANMRRVMGIYAKVDENLANSNEINDELAETVLPRMQKEIPGLIFDFEGEEKEERESMQSMEEGLTIALLVIFALLAVQLRSYTQPLIIMSVIPIGFIGAVLGHVLLGFPVSFFSSFGIVALSGVVVNDSLIMLDMINRYRAQGKEALEATIAAAKKRFRPIMFTSLTTCAGLSPIIFEKSVQAQFLIPMAISLAAGVLFATLITLLLVPALYMIRYQIIEQLFKFNQVAPNQIADEKF
ncbi:MAG: efflux RND transporter permease subunit [Pseudomonadota bacterium]